jgi:hypothetical protein
MLKRLLAAVIIAGALGAPLPMLALACAPHACCAPGNEVSLDRPDCCKPALCAPESDGSASVPVAPQLSAPIANAELHSAQIGLVPVERSREVPSALSPPLRLRLAKLSTLII